MSGLRLTKNEQLVLSFALTRADLSVAELSKQCKLKEPTVRRAIQRLYELKVFQKKSILINYSAIGMTLYRVAFSLSGVSQAERTSFLKKLCGCEGVRTVLELGGEYEFDVEYVARSRQEFSAFIDILSRLIGPNLKIVDLAIIESEHLFGHKFLLPADLSIRPLSIEPANAQVALDQTDHALLCTLSESGLDEPQHIAQRTGLPNSTFRYRLDRLKSSGVIAGTFHVFDVKNAGMLPFVLLVYSNGRTADLNRRMLQYCFKHQHIDYMISAIGRWSFAVYVDAQTFEDAREVSDDLLSSFKAELSSISLLPLVRFCHFSPYPFKPNAVK